MVVRVLTLACLVLVVMPECEACVAAAIAPGTPADSQVWLTC